ncbi:cytochrome P450 [Daldinia caldariorum]|uniref:cytochrome P450 n=1 Tax=Daldinia caldariorum TaxID=326644 RepID=UPI002007B0DD|nr:cytochrome P450 [Daldinia caldariorum]KAI1473054.1 cytochrome P450 [Daldinia caldariorum]
MSDSYLSATLTATLTLAAILIYKYIIYPTVFSPLSRIPTPHWSCSISPAWILWTRFNSRENRTLHAAHQQYGPIVRLGPNELSVNSVDAVKTIYQGGFDKHEWYSLFDNYGVPCTFSSAPAKHHSLRKKMVSHVYSKSYIHASPSLAAQADLIINSRLLPLLRESVSALQQPPGVDVHSLFCAAAMDFISAYCFGARRSADFIRRKPFRDHWLELYATRKGHGFFAQELPRLSRVLAAVGLDPTPAWVHAANRELEAWCKELSDAAIRFLEEEEGRSGKSAVNTADDPVVVHALLAGIEKEYETNGAASLLYTTTIKQRNLSIASEILDHVLAGQETTGVALTYLSYHLSQSPPLQRELRSELLTLTPSPRIGRDGKAQLPDSRQLDSLPLLHAVVTETVRRYAPAGGPEPRVTPQPSCRIGPYQVPGGTRVSASAYNLHRDQTAFPDPETWDHTRWLPRQHTDSKEDGGGNGNGNDGNKDEKDVYRHFWGFSSGGRMCLGSNFAMHDMKLMIAVIYANYTSHIVDDKGIEPTDAYTGRPKSNSLYLRYERVRGG